MRVQAGRLHHNDLPPGVTMPDYDPRVFFAAERTLLAWIRTGLGLVGLGFVVAKFGLLLKLVRPEVEHASHPWSMGVGIGLAILGAASSAVASWQHKRFCGTLAPHELPPRYRVEPALVLGFGVALAGLALGVVLAV
jgi:inner membrane protein YidH